MTTDPKITGVAVAEIVTTAGTQIRCEISESTVAEYAEALSASDCFPPVTIFHDGSQYILADGFHRVIAATRAGRETIFADVRTGSRSDALRFALSANATHGVRRTNADKRRSVELALAEWPKLSNRELARVCAVSDPFVSEIRQLLTVSSCDAPQTRIGADGRERKVPARKAAALHAEPADEADAPEMVEREHCETPQIQVLSAPQIEELGHLGFITDLSLVAGSKFACIYADPPWRYDNQATRAATSNHYETMTVDEICALPIGELAGENAHLHLWVTNAFLFDAPRIFDAWGFTFKSTFVWVKTQMGIGNYWRNSHEILLTAVKGKLTARDRGQMSWLQAGRNAHSEKPEEVRKKIEALSPGPRLELFGRCPVTGWTVFGNQILRERAML